MEDAAWIHCNRASADSRMGCDSDESCNFDYMARFSASVGLFRIKMNNDNGVINLVFVSVFFFCLVLYLCLIYVQRWGIYTLECHV